MLATLLDPAGRQTSWEYDDASRPTWITLPGEDPDAPGAALELGFTWDANSNVRTIDVPGEGGVHEFGYSSIDRATDYIPPDATLSDGTEVSTVTDTTYDNFGRPDQVFRPDGVVIEPVYDEASGRLTDILVDGRRERTLTYHPVTGHLWSARMRTGNQLRFETQGSLPRAERSVGLIDGEVRWDYDALLVLDEECVEAGGATSCVHAAHDRDSLLEGLCLDAPCTAGVAPEYDIVLDEALGYIRGTSFGTIDTHLRLDEFGAQETLFACATGVPGYEESADGTCGTDEVIFSEEVTDYDDLGRIRRVVESDPLGSDLRASYLYDAAGRLSTATLI